MTLVRAAAIMSIAPMHWLGVFIAIALAGRWAAVFLQALGDPILDDDSRRSLVATPAPAWLTAAISHRRRDDRRGRARQARLRRARDHRRRDVRLGVDAQRRDRGLSAPVVAVAAAIGELRDAARRRDAYLIFASLTTRSSELRHRPRRRRCRPCPFDLTHEDLAEVGARNALGRRRLLRIDDR